MLLLAVFGFILCILVLLWRINTKSVAMPVKGEEASSHQGLPAAEEVTHSPHPGEHSLLTVPTTSAHNVNNSSLADSISEKPDVITAQSPLPSGANSKLQPLPLTTQKLYKTDVPTLSFGPKPRERLKFILGASEDNSSDEENLVTKPPSGASQPPTSTPRSSPQQPSPGCRESSSSSIKYVCLYLSMFK